MHGGRNQRCWLSDGNAMISPVVVAARRAASLRQLTRLVVRLLWPARCAACAAVVDETQTFCDDCVGAVALLEDACPGCAMPTAMDGGGCTVCAANGFAFVEARAVFVYGGAVAQAIVRFKHGNLTARARALGRCLVPILDWARYHGVDAIVPVPLHPRRLRARGFNQARELGRSALVAARRSGGPTLAAGWLSRLRDTPSLDHEGPDERRLRVQGAFVVPASARRALDGRSVLLLDDVMTTGATLAACAEALLAGGAGQVRVAALARAI